MPIALSCDCGRNLRVKDELAGRKIRCPACAEVLAVPRPEPAAEVEDEPVTVMPAESPPAPAPRPNPREAVKRAETKVRPPSTAVAAGAPDLVNTPAVKRRKAPRSRTSRRSGPVLFVHREVVAGVLMMLGAVVWFVVGFALGWVFFYPPILFVLGIAAVVRGLTSHSD